MLKERIRAENSVVAFEGSGCVYRQGDLIDCYDNWRDGSIELFTVSGPITKIVATGQNRVRLTITRPDGGETLQWRMVYSYL